MLGVRPALAPVNQPSMARLYPCTPRLGVRESAEHGSALPV